MNMKAEIINPFLEATISVLETMAAVESIPGKAYLKNGSVAKGDVSGIVGITGDTEGSLSITFSKDCILYIVGRMFGENPDSINEEVKDAVGELTNMISGDSRRRLEEVGYHFSGSVPTVISGYSHEVRHITKGPVLSVPFHAQVGKFTLEVCFK